MHLIDFHTHIYPDAIARKATSSICEFYQLKGGGMDGTVETLLQQEKAAGTDRCVVLPVGLKPEHVRHINDFIVEQTARHPEFIGFGTIHAGMPDLTDEVQRIMKLGLHGIKMHPDTQLFAIDDPRLYPAYEQLQGRLPVLLHMGDRRYDYSHPARLRHVMELFPDLQFIGAHLGGYRMYETAFEILKDTNCLLDISSSLMFMRREQAVKFINGYGAERLVYGSDYPLWNPLVEADRFFSLDLRPEQTEQIAYRTALRILGDVL